MYTPRDYDLDKEYRQRQMRAVEQAQLAKVALQGRKARSSMTVSAPIPLETALASCLAIRRERHWLTWAAWKCRLCQLRGQNGVPARLTGSCHCPTVAARLQLQGAET
ncbi:MAG: hypothetical protein H6672_02640 [Anaerolineaceae bacterium]|nr:hypothetical protein [Anaerolineaceae bacterium]